MKNSENPSTRNNSQEDEPNESRKFAQRGADAGYVETPGEDGMDIEERDLLAEGSIGRESPNIGSDHIKADDKSPVFGHGFGSGTDGGLEAEHKAQTGHDSGIRREAEKGGGPVSTGL
jgi:hypothetical protein